MAAFFAGFCLIANGAYLLGGSVYPVGDAAELLRHGAARATLILFGIAAVSAGLYLWNGLGKHFGLGSTPEPADRRAAWAMSVAVTVIIIAELCMSRS